MTKKKIMISEMTEEKRELRRRITLEEENPRNESLQNNMVFVRVKSAKGRKIQ
jgi:hypothetical protein